MGIFFVVLPALQYQNAMKDTNFTNQGELFSPLEVWMVLIHDRNFITVSIFSGLTFL